ncbi:hypothetical protein BH18PSE1_BH18PSE1_05290 [soil metagenome]
MSPRVLKVRLMRETPVAQAWQTGTPLGNDRFKEQVEAMLGGTGTVGQARRGREKGVDRGPLNKGL